MTRTVELVLSLLAELLVRYIEDHHLESDDVNRDYRRAMWTLTNM